MRPYLKNNLTNTVVQGSVRRLREPDLDEIIRLQQDVMQTLQDSSLYVPSTRAEFLQMIDCGELYGMFADGVLCGACGFLPTAKAEDLAAEIGLNDAQRYAAFNLECYFVAPEYRGNGIARELAALCVERAVSRYGAEYILATVSPKNLPSLFTLMSINGFHIRALRQLYGCKLRYVLCCTPKNSRIYTCYERFSLDEVYSVSLFLARGYEGISLFKSGDNRWLWLAK